jgi:signal transduction histidine kinase
MEKQHDASERDYDSPLRKTQLGALVDAAARAGEGKNIRPATVRNICIVCAAIVVVGGIFARFEGVNYQTIIGFAMVFVGIVSGWAQLSFAMNPLYAHSTGHRIAIFLCSALSVVFAIGGIIILFIGTVKLSTIWIGFLAGLAMIAAIAIIVAPWWLTLIADLGAERAKAAREELRSDIASQLHDSVLQTLTLIQLNSTDAKRVASLARAQERDLRDWLYGDLSSPVVNVQEGSVMDASVAPAASAARATAALAFAPRTLVQTLKRLTASVEDSSSVAIEFVNVGDAAWDEKFAPMLDATREALLNATNHGKPPISVYCEVRMTWQCVVEIYVRDHGDGFDASKLPKGHFGVSESIIGRMHRANGEAMVTSRPKWGTEVKLSLAAAATAAGTGMGTGQVGN